MCIRDSTSSNFRPRPMKDKEASSKMAVLNENNAVTNKLPFILGQICRVRILNQWTPIFSADRVKFKLLTRIVSALLIWANSGHRIKAINITIEKIPGLAIHIDKIISTNNLGNDSKISIHLIIILSSGKATVFKLNFAYLNIAISAIIKVQIRIKVIIQNGIPRCV